MRIENHRLVGDGATFELDEQGLPLRPELIVIHYGVTLTAKATAAVLKARDYVSAHLCVGGGRVIQQVPFNRVAFHAGESSYEGRTNVNAFSVGIEIASPGPLVKRGAEYFPTWPGAKPWPGGVVEAWHKHDAIRQGWRYWAEYSQEDLDLCAHLCELLKQVYGVKDVVGHDDVSPGRKTDPGPAFPMRWLRETVFPGRHDTEPSPPP